MGQDDLGGGGADSGTTEDATQAGLLEPLCEEDRLFLLPPSPGRGRAGGILCFHLLVPLAMLLLSSPQPWASAAPPGAEVGGASLSKPLREGGLRQGWEHQGCRMAFPDLSALTTRSGSLWEAEDWGGRVGPSSRRGQRSARQLQFTRTILEPQDSALLPRVAPLGQLFPLPKVGLPGKICNILKLKSHSCLSEIHVELGILYIHLLNLAVLPQREHPSITS